MQIFTDIGNTNAKLGLFQETGQLMSILRVTSIQLTSNSGEIETIIRDWIADNGVKIEDIQDWGIASVVPTITKTLVSICENSFKLYPEVITSQNNLGINISVDNPDSVGVDRIMNVLAAKKIYGKTPLIVIDLGTATTIDVMNKKGDFVGGIICPGLNLSSTALSSTAEQLPKIKLEFPPQIIGKNTVHAMQSGLMNGHLNMIQGFIIGITNELKAEPKIVMTGGLSNVFKNNTSLIAHIQEDLTLIGIKSAWDFLFQSKNA